MWSKQINEIKTVIEQADALLITAGAGMGVDSGLPDFRGNEGFWKAYPPIAKMGYSFSDMANPKWFATNPKLAWAFYGHRLNLYRKTEPHKGFYTLLEFGKKLKGGYFVFTSNVDGQFLKAGFDENLIEECHGSIHHFQCTTPCTKKIWDASNEVVEVDEEKFEATSALPICPKCNRLARPNILMFGDWNWIPERSNKQSERFHNWIKNIEKNKLKLIVIEMGAGEAIPTVRMTSERYLRKTGGKLIRINPRECDVPHGHYGLPLGAAEGIANIFG